MEDDDGAGLSVGFAIDTGGAFAEVLRFAQMFDDKTLDIIRQVARVEQATGGMVKLGPATERMVAFGNATTREMQNASRAMAKVEKDGEAIVRQLERQNAAYGKTREELRATKSETAALAAEQHNLPELAGRIREQEAALQAAAKATAELRAQEAQRMRSAALAYDMFEAHARKLAAAAREAEQAEAALAREAQQLRTALDPMYVAQQRFNNELERADRLLAAGIIHQREYAQAVQQARDALNHHAQSVAGPTPGATAQEIEQRAQAMRSANHVYEMFEANARKFAAAARDAAAAEAALAREGQQVRAALDPMYAAQQRFDAELERADRLLAAGVLHQHEYTQEVQRARDALYQHARSVAGATSGTDAMGDAAKRSSGALGQLSFQLNDVVTMGLSGASAFQIVATQGGQVFQVFQTARGGAKALAAEIGGLVLRFLPLAAAAAVTIGPIIAATAAWSEYLGAIRQFDALAQGAGRASGLTGRSMEDIAERAADAANITVGAAREIETSYLSLGSIGANVLEGLTAITTDFAAATGGDAKSAAQELGAAFASPVQGAEELTAKYGVLSQAQVEHIRELVEQGNLYGAQKSLLDALGPAFDGASEHAGKLALAWRSIKNAASEAWAEMGRAIDIAMGGGSTLEKLQKVQQERAAFMRQTIVGFGADTSRYDKEIAALRQQLERERVKSNDAQTRRLAGPTMAIVDSVTGAGALHQLRANQGAINKLLADGGRAAGLLPEQIDRARIAQEGYNHAVRTYLPDAEKAVRLAQLDVQLAQARQGKDRGRIASLTAQRSELENAGKVITSAQAAAQATAAATRARLEGAQSVDRHAQTLAREAEAVTAQIRNTYKLVDAYGESGAAALVAEARVKAESAAIKKGADVEAAVTRQVQLAIAERVKAAAQGAATMRDQAAMQAEVNAAVADGLVPASQAEEYMRTRMAELPLLAAKQEAEKRGLTVETERATKALKAQQDAQEQLDASNVGKRFIAADKEADRRLRDLAAEAQLVGATEIERVKGLATIRATNEALAMGGKVGTPFLDNYVAKQVEIAVGTEKMAQRQRLLNEELSFTADRLDLIANNVANAGRGMADAFGEAGRAIGDMASIYASFSADRARLDLKHRQEVDAAQGNQKAIDRANQRFALSSATAQIGAYGDMASAAKGFFGEKSKGYAAMQTAEKAFRAIEFALSVRAMAQDAIETGSSIAKTVARTAVSATEAVVNAIKSLPFPLNLAAGAATAGALAALGVSVIGSFGGGGNKLPASNAGAGTVLGDRDAKSESIKRSIDALKEVDTLMLSSSREMASLLRSIDNQIGGVAALVVRAGNVNASGGVSTGFQTNAVGSVLKAIVPVFGGALASLFGTKTTVVGSGLSGGPQALGSILDNGFDASYYSDVQKKKKLFGITTSTKYSTQYTGADAGLEQQFTLILRNFNSAIVAAAGPLGEATDAIQNRLNGFVVNLGKIDLQGLTGTEIQEKLTAVFGAAADKMASSAFPGFERFQKVGEGAFETLVRVASTVEAVSASLDLLGTSVQMMGIDAKVGLAEQFDSISALTSAADAYFQAFYTKEEQAAAKTTRFARVFDGLGIAMPATLDGFRKLVEAQDLTTAAGQSTYAMLLQLAPAFADLQTAMDGAKSAADILAERTDLERKLLELRGDTAAIRALDLAKVDVSNRALQEQVWAIEDAQTAVKAASDLQNAWASVGDSIMDEVRRIRGLTEAGTGVGFAALQGQFNAATSAARNGDIDAAKTLPGLSQALLTAAEQVATSRQELDRVRAVTASSLEATNALLAAKKSGSAAPSATTAAAMAGQGAPSAVSASGDTTAEQLRQIKEEIAAMRRDNISGHAAISNGVGRTARVLEEVSASSGGVALAVGSV